MAARNLRTNAAAYLPYLLTCIFTVAMYYIISAIACSPGLQTMRGAATLESMMNFGTWVLAIFSVIFLLYTNSFLMKQRKKELGLYSILGLEKRHVAGILFFEMLYTAAIGLVGGLLAGMLLGKLLFLLLTALVKLPTVVSMGFSLTPVLNTLALFGVIYAVTLVYNILRVQLAKPIELLYGGSQGEKEPKASWLLTVLGVLCLGGGYTMAQLVQKPQEALLLFFVAVVLVILGTYALFTAGSIALLKALRKNKRFYYRSRNFISVSGMIYRMKQNAVGLANICILSTMVLVTVLTTVSLYAGQEQMLRINNPSDLEIRIVGRRTPSSETEMGYSLPITQEAITKIEGILQDKLSEHHVTLRSTVQQPQLLWYLVLRGDTLLDTTTSQADDLLCTVHFLAAEDFAKMAGISEPLGENEIYIYTNSTRALFAQDGSVTLPDGKTYRVKEVPTSLPYVSSYTLNDTNPDIYIGLSDLSSLDPQAMQPSPGEEGSDRRNASYQYELCSALEGEEEDCIAFLEDFRDSVQDTLLNEEHPEEGMTPIVRGLYLTKSDWYATYGGFLFLGIMLGSMFMAAAVLIIYYKQITEGYADRQRFDILQKVGMDAREVRGTINRQILMVFFLPLAAAVLHVVIAMNMIVKMLGLFALTNLTLIWTCAGVTTLIFAVLYVTVYALTAKTYYKLVR